ncbi:MAG TPA: DNA polymerase III subunit delta' [Tepidisphaeraceae bacterium]|nr:DNA polymerase III subunit delta' [Tepidisphaeraceae bacterium]
MITFADIFGQDAALEWLRAAYLADRLPHGLIFAGPVGVGKGTTAGAMAALFLCEHPKETTPCGKCESCRVFDSGNHPDHHVITKELIRYHDKTGKSKGIDLSIHVIRPELIDPAGRKAVMGRGKVFIIEQAELMNPQAQNALLKTLEEPAGRTLIILLTDQAGAMLPTIRSRCQLVRFSSLADEVVRKELQKRGTDAKLAGEAAALSRGSLGVALKWIADAVVEPARELAQQVDGAFEGTPPDDLPAWLKKAAEAYAQKQIERDELASKDQATREGLSLYLMIAGERFRKRLTEQQDPAELERACAAIDAIARAETYLDSNVNTAIALQQLALALAHR